MTSLNNMTIYHTMFCTLVLSSDQQVNCNISLSININPRQLQLIHQVTIKAEGKSRVLSEEEQTHSGSTVRIK